MDFADDECVPGVLPDFGAIFMCSSETRTECFRGEFFALPASYASFVKNVKSGMILFLFEFDSRQLYGVFQACSDGAMNIVRHTQSSLGKRFPAQVKFTMIWQCEPLSEFEFRDAIKDNYFAAYKFKFGLSEHQVHRLLLLFSQRKSKLSLPRRQFMRRENSEPPRNAFSIVGRVDSDKFESSDRFADGNDNNVNINPLPSVSPKHFKGRQEIDDDIFPTRLRMGSNKCPVENDFNQSIPNEYHGYGLVKGKNLCDDGRVSTNELGRKCHMGNDFDTLISRGHSQNMYGEVSELASDHSFKRDRSNAHDPIDSREHTCHLFSEGSSAAADHSLMRNTSNDFDPTILRDHPQKLFIEGSSAAADHSLMRNTINDFDPINSRDLPRNLFGERSSAAAHQSLMRNTSNDFDPINSRDHPRNLFAEGSSAAADHSLMRNTSNGVDPINSRDLPPNLFGHGGSSATSDHGLMRHMSNNFDPINPRDHPPNLNLICETSSAVAADHRQSRNYMMENEGYQGNSSGNKVRRVAYDDKFYKNGWFENHHNLEYGLNSGISSRTSANSFGRTKRIGDGANFSQENEGDLVNNQFMPHSSSHSLDPRISNDSYSRFNDDTVRSSPVAYDPDLPNIFFDHSLSNGADQNLDFVNNTLPSGNYGVRNLYSLSQNQSVQHHMQQPKASISQPKIKNCNCTNCIAGIPPSLGHPETKEVNYERYTGLYSSESSLPGPSAVRRTENQGLANEGPLYSSYPYRKAALVNENRYPTISDEQHENTEAFAPNVCPPDGPRYLGSTKLNCNVTPFNDNVESHGKAKGMVLDIPKKRNSVFERLSLAPKVKKQVDDISMGSNEDGLGDMSVNEIMGMLHRGHNCWMMAAKKPYPVEISRDKKHMSFSDKMLSISKSKKKNGNHAFDNGENSLSVDQDRPIVNFKRRSQLQEKVKQIPVKDQVVHTLSQNQPKKRKLVRPDLCNDVQVDDALSKNQPTIRKLARPDLFKDDQVDNALSKDQRTIRKLVRPDMFKDDQIDDSSPKNQPMKRKLVRPDMLKDYQIDDASPKIQQTKREFVRPDLLKDDQIDDTLPRNQPTKRKLVRPDLCKNDSSNDKDGNIDNSDKTISAASECKTESEEKNQEEDDASKKDIDKNKDGIDNIVKLESHSKYGND